MGLVSKFMDGLANVMSGAGTSVDKSMGRSWQERHWNANLIDVAYRGSWLMRKVVDLPPKDATRAWRDWQANPDQIEKLEETETRLQAKLRMREGLAYGRLGGGVVVMGVNVGNPEDPLPDNLGADSLRYLKAYSRHAIKLGPLITDPMDDAFGEPQYFILRGKAGEDDIVIHRDRVCVFKGRFAGYVAHEGRNVLTSPYWGESVVEAVNDAVMNAISASDEFATLIEEAKIDVFGIPDMLDRLGDPEYEKRLMRRLEIATQGKSNHRALVRDAGETWEQRQVTWTGMPDVIKVYLEIVAGAADIPYTRLLGKSADGMNATGEGDQSNYDQMIDDLQSNELAPALATLDRALIPSAIGTMDPAVYYEFAPLAVMSDKDASEVEAKEADTLTKIVNTALLPEEAVARAAANRMIESGRWPGLDGFLTDAGGEKWWETQAEEPDPKLDPITGLPIVQALPGQTPPKPGAVPPNSQTGQTPPSGASSGNG